jgi:hypothetical protein
MFFRRPIAPRPDSPPAPELPQAWPPGHFYSPIPNATDVATGLASASAPPAGIELNEENQRALLPEFERTFPLLRFPDKPRPGRRYFYDNGSFGALDALCLATLTRRFETRRIVEVGSGHSSAAMLDLRDDGLLPDAELTFVDPDFSRLHALLLPGDAARVRLIDRRVQDVEPAVFDQLEAGDLLFIDSSHVSKIGSDVNHLLFAVLPRLKPGVLVHLHDIFDGFEYPREWFAEGRHWNEQYLVRAFLMYNRAFEIVLHSAWLFNRHNAFFREHLPATLRHGGGQLWLRRA